MASFQRIAVDECRPVESSTNLSRKLPTSETRVDEETPSDEPVDPVDLQEADGLDEEEPTVCMPADPEVAVEQVNQSSDEVAITEVTPEALSLAVASEPIGISATDSVDPIDADVPSLDSGDATDTEVVSDTEISEAEVMEDAADPIEEESDNDIIFGGPGDDWLMGEGGNDMIFGNVSPIEDALLREVIAGRFRL